MPPVHRHSDSRACGATTTVTHQSTVFANNLLVAVDDDPNTHGSGGLIAACKQVFINNILTVNNTADQSRPDLLCPTGGAHCNPYTTSGSPNVFTGD